MSVYNGARFLREAIASVLGQTFSGFEFIVIDDGSTDETPRILGGYADPRIRVLKNERNRGLAASLNRALEVCSGELIARQDADDVSELTRLQRQVEFLNSHPEISLLGCAATRIDERGRFLGIMDRPTRHEDIRGFAEDMSNPFVHGSVMFRRRCIQVVGEYDTRFRLTQDYDLWLRMLRSFRAGNLAEPLYRFRFLTDSAGKRQRVAQLAYAQLARDLAAARRRGENLSAEPLRTQFERHFASIAMGDFPKELVASAHREEARWCAEHMRRLRAVSNAWRAIRAEGFTRDNFWMLRKALSSCLSRRKSRSEKVGRRSAMGAERERNDRRTAALMRRTYLGKSETFVYAELKSGWRYGKIVLTTRTENLDLFPWPRIHMPADLPRLSGRWLRDRIGRKLLGHEPYFEEVCRSEDVRVLCPHFAYDAVWAMPLKKRLGLPMVTTLHGADMWIRRNVEAFREEYDQLFEIGERFVVQGNNMRRGLEAIGCPAEKIRIVRLFCDIDRFEYHERPPLTDRLIMLFCGRFVEKKGLPDLLAAVEILKAKGRKVELRIVGYGELEPQLRSWTREHDLEDVVRFLGYQPPYQVKRRFDEAHVFCQPSVVAANGDQEGAHPTTLIEAGAMGCPVLGTFHCDIPEVVLDGVTGLLVPEHSPELLAEKAEWLMDHPEALNEFGRNARKHIETNFNPRIEAKKLEAIYDECIP